MGCKLVAYYRVSTAQQGESGLGLEAQKADVTRYAAQSGSDLIGSYTEVETGKRHSLDNRPELRRAIAHAKRSKAILVVAKLDRLLRSTVVCSLLKTSGARFVACDQPNANELTVDILAAVAEDEIRRISTRTKAALTAYKARGGVLGAARPECRKNLSPIARSKGALFAAAARSRYARDAYVDIAAFMQRLSANGHSLREIAQILNAEGQTTRRGLQWNPMQVKRVIDRATMATK